MQLPHRNLVGNAVLPVHARPLDLAGGIEEVVVEMMIAAAVAASTVVAPRLVPTRFVLVVVVDDDEVEVVLEHCWIAVSGFAVAALPEVGGKV